MPRSLVLGLSKSPLSTRASWGYGHVIRWRISSVPAHLLSVSQTPI